MDKFIVTMLAALADRERELISIRTRQALAAKKERDGSVHPVKGHVSNFTPEGRRKAAARKRAATSERFRQTVHYARLQREHGSTFQEIADKLNAEGYSSTTGKPFHATTVRRMLTA
jgi:DNA invertase Pin-like site-specific DNA recombinase